MPDHGRSGSINTGRAAMRWRSASRAPLACPGWAVRRRSGRGSPALSAGRFPSSGAPGLTSATRAACSCPAEEQTGRPHRSLARVLCGGGGERTRLAHATFAVNSLPSPPRHGAPRRTRPRGVVDYLLQNSHDKACSRRGPPQKGPVDPEPLPLRRPPLCKGLHTPDRRKPLPRRGFRPPVVAFTVQTKIVRTPSDSPFDRGTPPPAKGPAAPQGAKPSRRGLGLDSWALGF